MRFKVRHAMIVVVAVALSLGGYRSYHSMRQRAIDLDGWATVHDLKARVAKTRSTNPMKTPEQQEAARTEVADETRLRDQYREAASHPWKTGPKGE